MWINSWVFKVDQIYSETYFIQTQCKVLILQLKDSSPSSKLVAPIFAVEGTCFQYTPLFHGQGHKTTTKGGSCIYASSVSFCNLTQCRNTARPLAGPLTHLVFPRPQTFLRTKKHSCHRATWLEASLSQTVKGRSLSMALFVLKQLTIIEKFT